MGRRMKYKIRLSTSFKKSCKLCKGGCGMPLFDDVLLFQGVCQRNSRLNSCMAN